MTRHSSKGNRTRRVRFMKRSWRVVSGSGRHRLYAAVPANSRRQNQNYARKPNQRKRIACREGRFAPDRRRYWICAVSCKPHNQADRSEPHLDCHPESTPVGMAGIAPATRRPMAADQVINLPAEPLREPETEAAARMTPARAPSGAVAVAPARPPRTDRSSADRRSSNPRRTGCRGTTGAA